MASKEFELGSSRDAKEYALGTPLVMRPGESFRGEFVITKTGEFRRSLDSIRAARLVAEASRVSKELEAREAGSIALSSEVEKSQD